MDPVRLHTVFITHNRLELTKRALDSYLETVTVPFHLVIADNASTDGTEDWLMKEWDNNSSTIALLGRNRYPGFACNHGWELADSTVTHLHRADNDFAFLPGWCEEVERMFEGVERLGQLGLRTDEEEQYILINTGGNCVIPRELWDLGLRWDERPWPQLRDEVGPGWTEDSLMSKAVKKRGWKWDRVERPCIQPISSESADDDYYRRSWEDRGIYQ